MPVKPKEWKNGSTPTKPSAAVQAEDLFELLDVRADVVVAEHHALRLAGAAAGEDDRRQVVQRRLLLPPQRALQPANGQEPGAEQRAELLAGTAAWPPPPPAAHVSPGTLSFTLSRKAREVTTVLIPHWRMQEAQRLLGHGVVQVHRHLAHQQRREVHQRARHRRRQAAGRPSPAPPRPSCSRRARKTVRISAEPKLTLGDVASAIAKRNGCRRAVRTNARCSGCMCALRCFHASAMQFLHALPHLERRRGMRQRLAEVHRHAIGNPPRQLPEEAPLLEAEDAAPHAVQRHRDDRRFDVLHDALEAAAERQQVADARDLAFGEDADHLAVLDGLAGGAQRVEHFARAQLGGNGDDAQDPRKGLDPAAVRTCP